VAFHRAKIVDWDLPELHIYPIGDCHIGVATADEDLQEKVANIIAKDKYALCVGIGDNIEAIGYKDKRFDPSELAQPVNPDQLSNPFYRQALRFAKVWAPTHGKWALHIDGNHEGKASSMFLCCPTQTIADRLGGSYIGGTDQSGWLIVRLNSGGKPRFSFRIYIQHGWGGGETRGSDANKLQRLMWRKEAHLVVMGHSHRPMTLSETVEFVNNRGIVGVITRHAVMVHSLIGKHGYLARRGGNEPPSGYTMCGIKFQWTKKRTTKISKTNPLFQIHTWTEVHNFNNNILTKV